MATDFGVFRDYGIRESGGERGHRRSVVFSEFDWGGMERVGVLLAVVAELDESVSGKRSRSLEGHVFGLEAGVDEFSLLGRNIGEFEQNVYDHKEFEQLHG